MKFLSIVLLLAFASIFSGCNDLDCHPAVVQASFTNNSQIEATYHEEFDWNTFKIKPGENLVFNLVMQKAQCNEISDDESCEFLHFEIDRNAQNFELTPENFFDAKCFYHESAAWYIIALPEISQGFITGEKISEDEWLIHISVTPSARTPEVSHPTIEYEGVFTKQI